MPFVATLVSSSLRIRHRALTHYHVQYEIVTDIVVLDSELCETISPWSRNLALRCVIIRLLVSHRVDDSMVYSLGVREFSDYSAAI